MTVEGMLIDVNSGQETMLQPYYYEIGAEHKKKVSWAPDSKKLAFIGGNYGKNIYVINADGTNLKALTTYKLYGDFTGIGFGFSTPSWSPDSRYICCTYDRGFNIFLSRYPYYVYVIDTITGKMLELSEGSSPLWFPE